MSTEYLRATPAAGTFAEIVVPHLAAAYRLARWQLGNEQDAEDVVQEASLRAFRYFETFTGGNARAWFLTIVRNSCVRWRNRNQSTAADPFDEEQHSDASPADPEMLALQNDDITLIERAMRSLPDRSRELLVLRELQGMSYRDLADVKGIPIGTVMSGLSRARRALRRAVDDHRRRNIHAPARGR